MYVDGSGLKSSLEVSCDVAIVGTGAGGAVVGKELAERGYDVVYIEEGAYHAPDSHRDLPSKAVQRLYRNAGMTVALGTPFFPVPYACAVGGTTIINSGTCFRTPSDIHRKWTDDLGLPSLSEQSFDAHFRKVEKEINVVPADFAVMARSNTFVHEAMVAEGMPGKPLLRNVKDCKGCGMCCYGCTGGAKQSMDVSYMPKALKAGARVFTRCEARKFLRKGDRVVGIEGRLLDKRGYPTRNKLTVHAKITIVAAGTVNTPGLLRKGAGVRSPHLGKHLTVHPAGKIYMELDEDVMGWDGTPQAYAIDALHKEGILFEGVFLPPDVAATMNPYVGKELHDFMRRYKHMATMGFMIEDSSHGRIIDMPFAGPMIRYDMNQQDADKFKRATSFLAHIFLKHGAKKIIPMVHSVVKEIKDFEDLRRFDEAPLLPEDVEAAAFHPLGTARIGRAAEEGVIDPDCKVFGREGLYVCDGSIMPSALGVNPQLTIMAFADRLATHLHATAPSWKS